MCFIVKTENMDVRFIVNGITRTGEPPRHARPCIMDWSRDLCDFWRFDGYNTWVRSDVQANPTAVIADLQQRLTPRVLAHMHSRSISCPALRDGGSDEFQDYYYIELSFDDLLSEAEWNAYVREEQTVNLALLAHEWELPSDVAHSIARNM